PNRFRGIRHTVTWDPHPDLARRKQEGVLATAAFRAGAHVLARMGLSLDTGLYFPQLPELAAFAQAVPELTIILNHLGGLTRVGPSGHRDAASPPWRRVPTSPSSWEASVCPVWGLTGIPGRRPSARRS